MCPSEHDEELVEPIITKLTEAELVSEVERVNDQQRAMITKDNSVIWLLADGSFLYNLGQGDIGKFDPHPPIYGMDSEVGNASADVLEDIRELVRALRKHLPES